MKAILIIDMPKSCEDCPCYQPEMNYETIEYHYCGVDGHIPKEGRLCNCPLKTLPNPKDEHTKLDNFNWELESIINAENRGYNRLLEELLGEEE